MAVPGPLSPAPIHCSRCARRKPLCAGEASGLKVAFKGLRRTMIITFCGVRQPRFKSLPNGAFPRGIDSKHSLTGLAFAARQSARNFRFQLTDIQVPPRALGRMIITPHLLPATMGKQMGGMKIKKSFSFGPVPACHSPS